MPGASQRPSPPAKRVAGDGWWERQPDRLREELAALAAGGYAPKRDQMAERDGILRLDIDLPREGGQVPATITYPDEYPYFRPFVASDGLGLDHHWSPSTGEICLLDKAGDAWSTSSSAAALLDQQWPEVLRLNGQQARPTSNTDNSAVPQEAGSHAGEVAQAEPWTAYLDKRAPIVVVVPGQVVPPENVDGGTAQLLIRDPGGGQAFRRAAAAATGEWPPLQPLPVAVLTDLLDARGRAVWATEDGITTLSDGDREHVEVAWVRLREQPPNTSATTLWNLTGGAGAVGRHDRRVEIVLVALPEETAQRQTGVGWTALVRSRSTANGPWSPPAVAQVARAGADDLHLRAPDLAAMAHGNVLLAGVGGLGSALGAEIVRAGPASVNFLDGDRVDPATAVRALSAWRTAGMAKNTAMALLALEATPYTAVAGMPHRLGAPRQVGDSAEPDRFMQAWRAVQEADVVVDCTADTAVHLMLSDMCVAASTPFVLAEASVGVHGGTVALVDPTAVVTGGGCWRCLQHHINDRTIPRPPVADGPLVQPPGCGEPTYTGAGFDLTILAAHAARVVASVLTGPDGYGTFAEPVHVASLRTSQGAPIPAAWSAHPLPAHPDCDHQDRVSETEAGN